MTEPHREPHRREDDTFDLEKAEEDIKEIKANLKAAVDDLAFLKEKVEALPTTLQLIAFAIVVFAAANVVWLWHAVYAP